MARESRMHADEWVVLKTAKASTVDEFLRSPWYKRVFVLVRAMHPWITMQYVSLFRSHAVRAALIILKLVSAAAANAVFFISTSTTPDSDSACTPPQNFGERMLRAAIVGALTGSAWFSNICACSCLFGSHGLKVNSSRPARLGVPM